MSIVNDREAALALIVHELIEALQATYAMSAEGREYLAKMNRALTTTNAPVHPDDVAVESFANAMRVKLAQKREEGYGGWENPQVCTETYLAQLLLGHLTKGDPVDIGNFAMMLHHRKAGNAMKVVSHGAIKPEFKVEHPKG